jgi:hypothetical protein
MKLAGMISTAVLTLSLGIGIPAYAQEQHEQQEEKKPTPAQEKEKKAQPEKQAKPEDKNARQEEKSTNSKQETKPAKNEHAAGNGRIPDDRFKANFGRQHSFRVTEADYQNHRFQYGGYWFGFNSVWPSNWLYTQEVYVIDIDGVYYLCNASYPGVNLMLSVTL